MTLNTPRFLERNESFECRHCGKKVPPASQTCRDHCPYCLWSLHVDINPGDRAADCGGLLRPVGYYRHKKKGWMIVYRCEKCGTERVNKFLEYDAEVSDNFDALLALTQKG